MATGGSLFHLLKAGIAAINGDKDKLFNELNKAERVLERPPFSGFGDDSSD